MRMEDFASSYCVYISSANEDKGMNLEIWRRIGKDYSFTDTIQGILASS